MEIEDISWVGLSSGRSSQKEGHLSVSDGLLGEIVVDDEAMLSVISEVFTDSATSIRSQELKRSSFGSSSSNDNGVSESVVILKDLHDVRDSRSLLTDGDVNAVKSLGKVSIWVVEGGFLVNDGIDGDSGLSGLSISNDQLSLTSSNGDLF